MDTEFPHLSFGVICVLEIIPVVCAILQSVVADCCRLHSNGAEQVLYFWRHPVPDAQSPAQMSMMA